MRKKQIGIVYFQSRITGSKLDVPLFLLQGRTSYQVRFKTSARQLHLISTIDDIKACFAVKNMSILIPYGFPGDNLCNYLQNWIIEVSTYKKILQQLGTLLSLTNSIPSTSPVDIHIEFFPEIRRQVVAVSI